MSIVNKVKALGARATMSDEDIRSRLEKDHVRFREWTKGMCETSSPARRRALLAELKPNLVAHARAEERTAYDALIAARAEQDAHTLAREGYVEHAIVDELLTRLGRLDAASEEWIAHAKVLHELLTEHIDEEESDTFAELGANFSEEELMSLGARFTREKGAVMNDASLQQQTRGGLRAAATRSGARRGTGGTAPSGRPRRAAPKKAAKRGAAAGARQSTGKRGGKGRSASTRKRSG